jgi:hypothetical protein
MPDKADIGERISSVVAARLHIDPGKIGATNRVFATFTESRKYASPREAEPLALRARSHPRQAPSERYCQGWTV